MAVLLLVLSLGRAAQAQQVGGIVSAASYKDALTPGGIAAIFGQNLAAEVKIATSLPLPTTLAGTTVRVEGRAAELFFVAPGQINFIIPSQTPIGTARVEVVTSTGTGGATIQVRQVAPAILTANASGVGVPTGYVIRVRNGVLINESLSRYDAPSGFVPIPIDLGPEGDVIVLVLYGTGVRGAAAGTARVVLGGTDINPEYASNSPDLVGVDQINVILPRTLIGRGRTGLSIFAGGSASNTVDLEFASRPGPSVPPRINDFNANDAALAGERFTISGSGFSVVASENVVRIGGVEANVASATSTLLVVEAPFGVKSGKVSVRTPQGGEVFSGSNLPVRTSISGLVADNSTPPRPMENVEITVTYSGGSKRTATRPDGSFVIPDMPAGLAFIVVNGKNGTTEPVLPNLPVPVFKLRVDTGQDNRVLPPVALQQITGPGTGQPGNVLTVATAGGRAVPDQACSANPIALDIIDDAKVLLASLKIPANACIKTPAGTPAGRLNLTLVDQSRLPVPLPPAIFSRRIVQLTPFGATITPGAKLIFQNTDGLPANQPVDLYAFDQRQTGSDGKPNDNFGTWVKQGTATVAADGKTIETGDTAIKDATYYFAALPQQRTVAIGQVVDRAQPVRQVIVQVRGQNNLTDGNGGFLPPDVFVKQNGESVSAEATQQRASGGSVYALKTVAAAAGGLTNFEKIDLSTTNRPPTLNVTAADIVQMFPGEIKLIPFRASDPEDGDKITILLELFPQNLPNANPNANFQSVTKVPASPNFDGEIRLAPKLDAGVNDVGEYQLKITVRENSGAQPLEAIKVITIKVLGAPGAFTLQPARVECDTVAPSGPVVHLSWSRADRAESYDVFRDGVMIKQGLAAPGYDDKDGLTASGSYTYKVTAHNTVGTQESQVLASIPDNVCTSFPVTVTLDQVTGARGTSVLIPVRIGDLTLRGAIAFEFDLAFDPAVLQFQGLEPSGTLSGSMTALSNVVDGGGGLRVLRVGAFTTTPLGNPNRVLLRLRFNVVGQSGASTALVWQRFVLNEGSPPVTTAPGRFTVN